MKTIEFEAVVAHNGQILIPVDVAGEVPTGEPLHVVLQWDAADDERRAWQAAGIRCFEAAYAAEDAVYEQLVDDAPIR
ncbi:MAG: hypothetical protein ACKV22_16870 [Bryobacteraceae bacterium]